MSPQTETKTGAGFTAGVKDYRLTYYTPDYKPKNTDILAAFRMTPQPGVPAEECGAAVAAESSTGTWTTVWTDGLTNLDRYKGRCFDIEAVAGEENQYICYVAYPIDLFEEGSVTNLFTSIVGNVFGFKARRIVLTTTRVSAISAIKTRNTRNLTRCNRATLSPEPSGAPKQNDLKLFYVTHGRVCFHS